VGLALVLGVGAFGMCGLGAASAAPAEPGAAAVTLPGTAAVVDKLPDDHLDGDEIYRRVQRNRLHSYVQDVRLVSGDRGANDQETRLVVTWKNYRAQDDAPTNGVFSKTVIRYTHPFDVRFTTYLIIDNADRVNDQFVYLPSRRRVRRVNLRGESVLGTDFSFEDVVPRELEHSTHKRMPDDLMDGTPCYVVEAVPQTHENSEYSRFILYVEKDHYVPLRTRYFDPAGVEIKELKAPATSIQEFHGVWLPMQATMRQLQQETYTHLTVEKLEPNPELADTVFEVRRLEAH
jgi:hypothetical protein